MEVTCDRCGAEYEFEEALVSTGGTTVKCTGCGHLFKVHRLQNAPDAQGTQAETDTGWTLRRPDGSELHLPSLAELTRRIRAGELGAADEISRTGRAWRRLGDIPELQTFFPQPRPRTPELGLKPSTSAPPAPPPRARRSTRPQGSLPPTPPSGASLPPAPAHLPAAVNGGQLAPATGELSATHGPPPATATSGRPGPEPTSGPAPGAPPVSPPGTLSLPPAGSDAPPRPATPSPLRWLLPLLALLAVGGWFAWSRLSPPSSADDPAARFVERADAALASHRRAGFDEAIAEYTKALAFHPYDGHILSSLSRVYAVSAQAVHFERSALAAQGNADRARTLALMREAQRLAATARQHAETAARKNPGNSEAEIALADALRLTGNLVGARNELDRARSSEAIPEAETLRVAALLAIAEHGGDMGAGRELSEQAVAQDPTLLRARALLFRILLAQGELDTAARQLETIRTQVAPHPLVDELSAQLRVASGHGEGKSADTGSTAAPGPTAQPSADAATPEPASTDTGGDSEGDGRATPAELCTRGERLLETGKVPAAQRVFQRALAARPGYPRARTGLGYVALEQGQPWQAVRLFKPASRSGYGDALIGLGEAYRKLGKLRDALGAYQRYVDLHPDGGRLSIARRQIERLSDELEP